jgi:hypothetical protein
MAEKIEKYSTVLRDKDGITYEVEACGGTTPDGLWEGWLEFSPSESALPVLRTDRETTQPNRQALEYWATGLEPVYFEGAFNRALERR